MRAALCDFSEFAQFIADKGINSISFNEDLLLKCIENIVRAER
jgi:pyruvate,water dikinase